ncbi:MAG: hypothetical protein ACU85U_20740 [Gammaproteobacteria bacterium]|jgi:hypothetical protein
MKKPDRFTHAAAALLILCNLTGCAGTIIATTTDAALAVAKVPFKAGGAIVDVISGDEDDD